MCGFHYFVSIFVLAAYHRRLKNPFRLFVCITFLNPYRLYEYMHLHSRKVPTEEDNWTAWHATTHN